MSLKMWIRAASTDEMMALAREAGTSRGQLYQLANGGRKASAELAGNIAQASKKLARRGLPALKRTALCVACSKCEYARGCK